jgi:hypothetical protein
MVICALSPGAKESVALPAVGSETLGSMTLVGERIRSWMNPPFDTRTGRGSAMSWQPCVLGTV